MSGVGDRMRGVRCVAAGVALMVAALLATPAVAQTTEQINWCNGSGGATPDQQVTGCTAVIKSRTVTGDKLAIIYNLRGNAYLLKKEYDLAIEDYDQSILHDISNGDTFYNRGVAFSGKGNFDRAITDFTRAISGYDPSRHPAYYKRDYFKARGNAFGNKGDFEKAIADYDEAIKIDPKFARAYYNRAVIKTTTGDKAGSDADFAQAKQLQANIGPE